MEIADFVTEVPTPDPLLRRANYRRTMSGIGGADRQGGVETLVTEGQRAIGVRGCEAARVAPLAPAWSHHASTRPYPGGRVVTVKDGGSAIDREDRGGLDETFRTLSPWLRRNLRTRLGGLRPDIDDLVQESFIRLSRYGVEDRQRHPRALLLRIAGNLTRDALRREAVRGGGRHVTFDAEAVATRLAEAADQHARLVMKQAILDLPKPLRDVFTLSRFTPMTNVEIAHHLAISVKTVEWRLAKATSACLAMVSD